MTSTEQMIDQLATSLEAITPLAPPRRRAGQLILTASLLIAAVVLLRGPRADLAQQLADPSYWIAVIAAWCTGACATLSALEISLPDRPRLWAFLPVPAGLLWVSGVSYGCLAHWISIPPDAPVMHDSIRCLETLIGTSIPLAVTLWTMLRRTCPLRPIGPAWLAAIAVAAFADVAHLLIHVVGATSLVLVMNLGVAGLITMTTGLWGQWRLRR